MSAMRRASSLDDGGLDGGWAMDGLIDSYAVKHGQKQAGYSSRKKRARHRDVFVGVSGSPMGSWLLLSGLGPVNNIVGRALRAKIGPDEAPANGFGGSKVEVGNVVWLDLRGNPKGRGQPFSE